MKSVILIFIVLFLVSCSKNEADNNVNTNPQNVIEMKNLEIDSSIPIEIAEIAKKHLTAIQNNDQKTLDSTIYQGSSAGQPSTTTLWDKKDEITSFTKMIRNTDRGDTKLIQEYGIDADKEYIVKLFYKSMGTDQLQDVNLLFAHTPNGWLLFRID